MNTRGIIMVAFGEKATAEARAALPSLATHMPDTPLTIITPSAFEVDAAPPLLSFIELAPTHPEWQQSEHEIPEAYTSQPDRYLQRCAGLYYKVQALAHSPYEHTLYLDADVHLLSDVSELFELAQIADLTAAVDSFDRVVPAHQSYPSVLTEQGSCVAAFNTGVMVYQENARVDALLAAWERAYRSNLYTYPSDQTAFLEALLDSEIQIRALPPEYNFRVNSSQALSRIKPRILHGRPRRGWQSVEREFAAFNDTIHVWFLWDHYSQTLKNITSAERRLKEALRPLAPWLKPIWKWLKREPAHITR